MVERFNEEQKKAITWYQGPCLVLGTPGSGKTTVIINRIRHLLCCRQVAPEHILVITFTRAAAQSMQQRFLRLMAEEEGSMPQAAGRVRFGTFHSVFFWIIKTAYHYDVSCILSEEERRRIIRKILADMHLTYENYDEIITSVIRQIEILNCDMIEVSDYYSKDMPAESFRNLYKVYSETKRKMGKIDFDDMMNMCYRLLVERQDILCRLRQLYPYIMVDEFQDTNRIQYEILKLLAHPEDNLFVVGDDDQSIYGFRGARPDIMLGFGKEFQNTELITLGTNYRCPQIVTERSARLIAKNKKRYSKALYAAGKKQGSLTVEFPEDIGNENDMILQRIRESYREGVPYGDMAVLYRTNMNPRRLIFKLREFNIPFAVNDNIPDIFQHFTVQTVLDYILFAIGDNTRERFLRFMNKPVRYISRDMLNNQTVELQELLRMCGSRDYLRTNIRILNNQLKQIARLTPYAAISYIRKGIGYDDYLEEYADIRNIDYGELQDLLDEFQSMAKDFETYGDFFDFIDAYSAMMKEQTKERTKSEDHGDKVQLMTMHSAKGLEFRDVHIIECVEEIIPHKKQKNDAELEEERRMFYVAMTRTKENLYLYAPKKIGHKSAKPSRFLYEQFNIKN